MVDFKQKIIQQQLAASNPKQHVWVNASAGSGKTKVLVDRILRLLLQGVNPSSILCITFTKAGAVEMRSRLNLCLENWVFLTDEQLVDTLKTLEPNSSKEYLKRARGLLNLVLDTPVKIETIHSFAQNIVFANLSQTDIAFGASLMDETQTKELLKQSVNKLISCPNLSSSYGVRNIHKTFSKYKFDEIVKKISEERSFFKFLSFKDAQAFSEHLSTYIGGTRNIELIESDFRHLIQSINPYKLLHSSAILSDSDKLTLTEILNVQKQTDLLKMAQVFLTSSGKLKKRFFSKKLKDSEPEQTNEILTLIDALYALYEEWKAAHLKESSVLVFQLAKVLLDTYETLKKQKACLDYDDLIFTAIGLLSNKETSSDVLYQLDIKLQHVLIDEAQDTNIYQWKLIELIVDGFFDQVSDKTMFVVGDHKQAIFSFQGTDPDIFHTMQSYYALKQSDKEWSNISLNTSFRSLDSVLRFVDSVFSQEQYISMYSNHNAFFGKGGHVVQHPLVSLEGDAEEQYKTFGESVAEQVKICLQNGYDYGDILMLIRKRGIQLDYVQDALNRNGIPFSSPNKKRLFEDDLVKLVSFILVLHVQPYDESISVHMLLNPLLGLKETAIKFALSRLDELTEPSFSVCDVIPGLSDLLDKLSITVDIEDKLFAILSWAYTHLSITQNQISNAWLFRSYMLDNLNNKGVVFYSELFPHLKALQLSQQSYQRPNSVNILTVHGSKGLQAKVVMLLDTTQTPVFRSPLLKDSASEIILCANKLEMEPQIYKELKAKLKDSELQEYYRLLYVALTRAAEELHIFGVYNKDKVSEETWYSLCEKAAYNPIY